MSFIGETMELQL